MPTTYRYPRKPSEPLDLGDIRKTQRRVAALLQVPTPRGGLGATSHRKHIPHSYCYVCSKLDPEGRFMGNPYRYLFGRGYMQRCSHVPAAPHPTFLMDDHPNTPMSDYMKTFDTRILNKDELPKVNRNKFKVPPTFESEDLEDGRLLPLVSENTFLTTNPPRVKSKRRKTDGRLSLPSLSGEPNYLVAREQDDSYGTAARPHSQEGKGSEFEGQHWEDLSDNRISVDLAWSRSREAFAERSGIGPWKENEGNEGGVLRYKHKNQEDWVRLAGSSDPFRTPDKHTPGTGSRDRTLDRELSFDFKRRGTFSVSPPNSRASDTVSSPDFMFSRMHSASWCECVDVDIASLRCRECFQTGDHENWCVSKVGICPKCGKPVRRKHSNSTPQRQRTSSSPSKTFVATRTDLSTSSHNREECSSRKKDVDQRVRFHDNTNMSFVKESKKGHGSILKKDSEKPDLLHGVNPSLPKIDPNVHRQAYVLALAEARVRMFKKDPFVIEHAHKRRYFSYFPLYKHPQYRPIPNTDIGIKQDQDGSKKIKLRQAMKHVLGDIKLADYYPGGKKYPTALDQTAHASRQP